ncbi:MAG TPA: YdaS family helix-turn-helix protein [Sphingomonas sp.]|nr:YdaS family helix-turn-helix protein [Sphingomonas sp.]
MESIPTRFEALEHAVKMAQSQVAFAEICGIGQPAVSKMLASSKQLAPEYVLAVERATGVSRHLLRPDIYPVRDVSKLPKLPALSTTPKPRRRRRHANDDLHVVGQSL